VRRSLRRLRSQIAFQGDGLRQLAEPVVIPSDGDQLELELDDVRLRIPWGGRSPRELTRCGKLFILSELPTGGPNLDAPDQLTMFLKGTQNGS